MASSTDKTIKNIAALLTCHNRRKKTVDCLLALRDALSNEPKVAVDVYLVDDGSNDGTSEAVNALGMGVRIIRGQGDLFWNRGMIRAWEVATTTAKHSYDGFLLLNDDTILDSNAIKTLLETSWDYAHRAIIVGATRDPDTGEHTYGGVRQASSWHPGRTKRVGIALVPQSVDTFNANCVLVPRFVFDKIGMLDPTYTHGIGDFDYGLRARAAGLGVIVAPGTIGACARNDASGTWMDPRLPLTKRFRLLQSPRGLPYREWCAYLARHGAPLPAILALSPILRIVCGAIFPDRNKS